MRTALGDGYVKALRSVWTEVPESSEFVMHWWCRPAALVATGAVRRFGLITTNSLRQIFNRRVVQAALDKGVTIELAIPDHPWVENANGAAVRIAMTVVAEPTCRAEFADYESARHLTVTAEQTGEFGEVAVELNTRNGVIHADLSVGQDIALAQSLQSNESPSNPGVQLVEAGLMVSPEEATLLLPLPLGGREARASGRRKPSSATTATAAP